ncbi:glycosyl transferase family 2, partial [Halorubrum sp. SS5]
TDCTNGYRAIRGSEIGKLTLTEERFSAPELIIEARKNGMQIEEIPIVIQEREAGETKKPQLGYALGLTRTVLTTWIR